MISQTKIKNAANYLATIGRGVLANRLHTPQFRHPQYEKFVEPKDVIDYLKSQSEFSQTELRQLIYILE